MDVQPLHPEAPVAAYPRSAIDDFVANAASEQRNLEQAVAEARKRERRAEAAIAESQATARLVRSTLHDLRRELDERRRQVDAQVEGILERAFDEAGSILADAGLAAKAEAPRAPVERLAASGKDGPPPVAAPADPTLSTRVEPTEVTGNGASPLVPTPAWPAPSPFARPDAPIDGTAALKPTDPPLDGGNGSAGPEANGKTAAPDVKPGDGQADGEARVELDLTAPAGPERRRGPAFGSLLRRSRDREAPPEEPPPTDEFLDFLRGALVDDRPLDAPGRDESDAPWRPRA